MSKGISYSKVVLLGKKLPGVTESTSYGTAALKVGGKLLARLKEDGETLVLRMDIVNRDLVMRADPRAFFITDHYRDYDAVLVRLSEVKADRMRELLEDAWEFVAPPKLKRS